MKRLRYLIPALPVALSAASLLYLLETYTAHADTGFVAESATGAFAAASLFIAVRAENKKRPLPYRATCIACLVLCAALVYIASQIPFCPMCDGELYAQSPLHPLLSHWIPDGP